jgi:DNA-directed RNA polymerase specialized sigma24 family protein
MMRRSDANQDRGSHSARNGKGRVSNHVFAALVTDNYAMYINKCYAYLKCRKLAEDAVQEGVVAAQGDRLLAQQPKTTALR